ncbi:hypothetical protein VNI00_008488 [Paramarasmius palmivorus]|uniref:F-box domain-containing protein n=1 Tax=Paramarasmius palmivorus TaxID=297713 RepID=A0AAW0CVK2_9AGAR
MIVDKHVLDDAEPDIQQSTSGSSRKLGVREEHLLEENQRLMEENLRLRKLQAVLEGHIPQGTAKELQDKAVQTIFPYISFLPPEILAEIFTLFCMGGSVLSIYTQSSARFPPFILGHVCRSWRALAWETPQLWAVFAVDIGACNRDILSLYLRNSREFPLSIRCIEDGEVDVYILRAVLAHSRRWRSGSFRYASPRTWRKYINTYRLCPPFTALESLDLGHTDYGYLEDNDWNVQDIVRCLLGDTPRLHVLTAASGPGNPRFPLPYTQITSFIFNDWVSCLSSFKGVESFFKMENMEIPKYLISWTYAATMKVEKPVRLQSLKNLTIRFFEENDDRDHISLYPLFRVFRLPLLTTLVVTSPRYEGTFVPPRPWDSEAFIDMVVRSRCTLENLTVSNLRISELDLEATLHSLPMLKSFTYHECRSTATTRFLLDLMTPKHSGWVEVAPTLTELGIALETGTRVDEETRLVHLIVEMARGRRVADFPALDLTLRVQSPLHPSNRQDLHSLCGESIGKLIFGSA